MNAVVNSFPGYELKTIDETNKLHNIYRGEDVGFGGYVYAEPGLYSDVAVLDIASQHPTSIIALNLFGNQYTPRFKELLDARIAIKRKNFDAARTMLNGKLAPYLVDTENSADLAYALKIAINSVYGLTSAGFPNPFKDNRNVNNIVALRGALFMVDLKHAVQERGFTVAHIKTDSIKIPNATQEIIDFVFEFGKKYGYDFEHEGTYDKFCLVNDAVYIARENNHWTAVGAQFQHPYVFKKLFTHEPIGFDDYCETKNVVQGTMYLDFSDGSLEPDLTKMVHVGRTGSFVPVCSSGATLWRVKDGKYYAVTGTKGYRWIEREMAALRTDLDVDMTYFNKLEDDACEAIEFFGPFKEFML